MCIKVSYKHGDLSHFLHSHSELAWFRLSPADERASPADGHMSMRQWVGYAVIGMHGHGARHGSWVLAWRSLVMGMRAMGGCLWAWACVGAWGVRRGGRSPMAMAGGGGEWGPHTKESIKCIPQSGTHKIQKAFPHLELTRYKRSSFPDLEYPHNFNRFHKTRFPEK